MTIPKSQRDRGALRVQPTSWKLGSGELHLGDCLNVLARCAASNMRFDLVYVDPPFNAGGVRAARLQAGHRASGTRAYHDAWGGLEAFLEMLKPRLAAMRDAMSEHASLWLHLDHRTVHDVKVVADQVFGSNRFRGEVIWVPGNGGRRRYGLSVTHQTILVFSKTRDMLYNVDDPALREPFAETSRRMHFKLSDEDGRRYRERRLGGRTYRYYEDAGRRIGSVWSDCPSMRANTPLTTETTGYPTQKPVKLLSRIILATTTAQSRVLDPMCGSGTTLFAAQKLGRAWLGVDRSELACKVSKQRLELELERGRSSSA